MKKLLIFLLLITSTIINAQPKINLLTQSKLSGVTGISVITSDDEIVEYSQPGSGLMYLRSNSANTGFEFATISLSFDTTDIVDFYIKTRGLFSAGYGLNYSDGHYEVDTTEIATQYDISQHISWSDTVSTVATQYDLTQKKDLFTIDIKMLSTNLADGITYFIGNIPQTPITASIARNQIDIPYDCTLVGASIMFASFSAVGTNENISIYIRVNNTTDHLVATIGAATADRLFENMSLSVALTTSDYIHGKIVCPTWSTNPTQTVVGGTLYFER